MTKDAVRGSSDRGILVLTSLAGGPKHGYALIKDIQGFAGVTMGPGTLYGALSKLEAAGLIEPLPAEERRHPYRITPSGHQLLRERLSESARVASVGLARLAGATASIPAVWSCALTPAQLDASANASCTRSTAPPRAKTTPAI